MTLGLSLADFTTLHVVISLLAIVVGLVVLADLLNGRRRPRLVTAFLATTILTSVTGFMFPNAGQVTPAHIVGGISLVLLAIAVAADLGFDRRGRWHVAFAVTAVAALYLNVFVGVVQAFQKLPPLTRLAPTQSELPFVVAQTALLLAFVAAAIAAARRPN